MSARPPLLVWALYSVLSAQNVITTIAGTDAIPPLGPVPANSIYLPYPYGVAADAQANVYAADFNAQVIYKITPDGRASVIAGTGLAGYSGDGGPGRLASINGPQAVAVDAAGNVYFTQFGAVRMIDSAGIITTVAGGANNPNAKVADGIPADSEKIVSSNGVAVGPGGRVYVSVDNRVLLIQDGIAKFFAGTGTFSGYTGDGGPALSASLSPAGLATDAAGNLYIADTRNSAIRKVDSNGIITSVVGAPSIGGVQDGVAGPQTLTGSVLGVAVDGTGQVYFTAFSRIRYLGADGIVRLFAGNGTTGYSGDGGPALKAAFGATQSVAVDGLGNVHVSDLANRVIRKIDGAGVIATEAGTNLPASGVQPALTLPLGSPYSIAVDGSGNVFVGETDDYVVRRISPDGTIRTFAGNGALSTPYSGKPVPATSISVNPAGLVADASGNLYISSLQSILRVSPDGVASLVLQGFSKAGGLTLDALGNLYVTDSGTNLVFKIAPGGEPTIVAGNGKLDSQGDGGKATDASVFAPLQVAVANGNVYIGERNDISINNVLGRVRVVTPDGLIHTIAGNGQFGSSADGIVATASPLNHVGGLAVDSAGSLYFSEFTSGRIRTITSGGTLQTIAGGKGASTFSGDGGPANAADLSHPQGITFDPAGNLYIADSGNHRVRKVLVAPPAFTIDQNTIAFAAQAGGAPAPPQTISVTGAVPGIPFTVSTSAPWLQAAISSGTTPRQVSITADPATLDTGDYQATLTFQASGAQPAALSVTVTFNVSPGQPAQLQTNQDAVTFTLPRSGGRQQQLLTLSNSGSGSFSFTASPTTRTGGNWLSVSPAAGTVTARQRVTLTITTNVQGLAPGTYAGQIPIEAGSAGSKIILATLTVSASDQAVLLTQTGLSFTAVSGGGLAPSQSFGVKNIGTGNLSWTASPTTTDGATWLSVAPVSGSSVAGAASPLVSVSVDHRNLAPKPYYGLARINAPGAANTPQVVTVHLDVLPPGADPGAVIQPAELVFTTLVSGESPGALELLVYNLTASPISFRSGATQSFQILPFDAVVLPGVPVRILVQPAIFGVIRTPLTGTLTLQFANGQVRSVPLRVEPLAGVAAANLVGDSRGSRDAAGCSPTKLIPTLSVIGQSSVSIPASWPNGLNVDVQDDCKRPITAGTVYVQFSNGDEPLSLTSNGDGKWQGTWTVQHPTSPIKMDVAATETQTNLTGTAQATASLQMSYDPPVATKQGVVSAANPVANQPLTPGGIISIYGQKLASSASPLSAPAGPLPSTLGDTSVLLGGLPVPLFFVSSGQINGVVPWNLPPDTQHQLLIQRGLTYSNPIPLSVAQAQPALFLYPQSSAPSQGIFVVVRPNAAGTFLNTPSAPAQAGDTLVIYSLGLGTVTNQPNTGLPSPSSPLARTTVLPVLKIGDRAVDVAFSGLSPFFVGLYQVQATLPAGLATGAAIPVTLEIAGQISNPVTIALQ